MERKRIIRKKSMTKNGRQQNLSSGMDSECQEIIIYKLKDA